MSGGHPLLAMLLRAAAGEFPPVDGGVTFTGPLAGGRAAVVCFTGHAVLASAVDPGQFDDLRLDGFGRAMFPAVLLRLAGPGGHVEDVDVTLVARGRGGGTLPVRSDLDTHPRVRLARRLRCDVSVHGDARGVVTVSRGLAGRTELSVEAVEAGGGAGAGLIRDALALVPAGEAVFAAVSPGNARSLRAFLREGFVPIGSEVLIVPAE